MEKVKRCNLGLEDVVEAEVEARLELNREDDDELLVDGPEINKWCTVLLCIVSAIVNNNHNDKSTVNS